MFKDLRELTGADWYDSCMSSIDWAQEPPEHKNLFFNEYMSYSLPTVDIRSVYYPQSVGIQTYWDDNTKQDTSYNLSKEQSDYLNMLLRAVPVEKTPTSDTVNPDNKPKKVREVNRFTDFLKDV